MSRRIHHSRIFPQGEFDTSSTTDALFSASASPSPVTVLTPELGDAAIASFPLMQFADDPVIR